ncbi:hypothetical protein Q4543_02135 [Salipiger sp. 1_MG-2023]|uniref:hypothetical protein n=1 Tax=Salipiger sp. 1_MG-2023 TaxID=3062665 RepID=UPI0026E2EC65|nr:hypothetical protein [Salipiger sp. 1_MG-2023]MDO6584306.1 hypothetical protein [Salipiger sp. 1_MG-2023]
MQRLTKGFLGTGDISGLDLTLGSLSLAVPRGWELGVETTLPVWSGAGYLRSGAALGAQKYRLPDGVGIFVDPGKLTLRQLSAWAELGHRHELWRGGAVAEGSVGLLASHMRARYRSALIARTEVIPDVTAYVGAGIELPLTADLGLGLHATRYGTGITDIRFGVLARY